MRASQECILDCNRYELLQISKEQACHETSKGLEGQNSCRQTVLYCHLERHLFKSFKTNPGHRIFPAKAIQIEICP